MAAVWTFMMSVLIVRALQQTCGTNLSADPSPSTRGGVVAVSFVPIWPLLWLVSIPVSRSFSREPNFSSEYVIICRWGSIGYSLIQPLDIAGERTFFWYKQEHVVLENQLWDAKITLYLVKLSLSRPINKDRESREQIHCQDGVYQLAEFFLFLFKS